MNDIAAPLYPPERWREVRETVERIDASPPEERERELKAIAAADTELARAVQALLKDQSFKTTFPVISDLVPTESPVPAQIGPFRPLLQLGYGGMGRVYLAERRGMDFTQRVALKLFDAAGTNVAHLIARERSILAALTHPNITAFVDAGTENGQPWLAMEYVDGEPLLDYCSRLQLDGTARVHLFEQICAAVAYAHSQLVVHRDLKPSNVLINRVGTVKLLDFGIATVVTADQSAQPATRVFTPEYAAPEQLRGERATTATDVYALGLMLYELVVGRRLPTVTRKGGNADWTTAELVRFASSASDAPGPTMPVLHKETKQMLHGDLGHIIRHAIAFDPAERYGTVAQLHDDLLCWRDHRPLSIGRRKFSYVASRFVRRHRLSIAAAAAAMLVLVGTTIFALWQAHEAHLMAQRADHAKTFLAGLFTDANPYNAKRGNTSTVELLRGAAQRIDSEFADAPQMQVELRSVLIDSLTRLDEPKLARELAQRNVDQLRQTSGPHSPQVGAALADLALSNEEIGDIDGARADYAEAYALLRDAGSAWARNRISVMTGLAKMANRRDDYAEGQRWHEAVLQERMAREGPESQDIVMDLMNLSADAGYQEHFAQSEALGEKARVMLEHVLGPGHARSIYVDNALGYAQVDMGHYSAAIGTFTRAVATARQVLPAKARMLGTVLTGLGRAQFYAGNDAAAVAALSEARSIAEANNPDLKGIVELRLGLLQLREHGNDALPTLRSALADLNATASHAASAAPTVLWAQAAYGAALAIDGNIEEGELQARKARESFLTSKNFAHTRHYLAEIDRLLADILNRKGASAEANDLRQEALGIYESVYGISHPLTESLAVGSKGNPSR